MSQQQRGLKYVCCGSCRQWLSAPIESQYVYCPGCESVNNCRTDTQQSSTSTTPSPAQNNQAT
jgi:LSD1 subclass zinc finger protein